MAISFKAILLALCQSLAFALCLCACLPAVAAAADAAEAPDVLVRRLSADVLDAVKADKQIQAGDVARIMALVDSKILPFIDFKRMTAAATGRYWRQATADQQMRLQEEFKVLLIRTYAGALAQARDQSIFVKPLRMAAEEKEVIVRTEVRGRGEPIQLDYRMDKESGEWRILDVNVLGVWLVENYRNTFAQEIGQNGMEALIAKLAARNKILAAKR